MSFVFDDGYKKVFDEIVPLLRQYRFPAVFAIPIDHTTLNAETNQAFVDWNQWLTLKQAGHEIAAHSKTHIDLTRLSADQVTQELVEPIEKLHATTLVYPGGAYNNDVKEQTKKYYRAARTLNRGFNARQPADLYELQSFDCTRKNYSPFKANTRALWAYLTNSWLIETYHLMDDALPNAHSVRISDFARHLAFIARLPIEVKTITQVVSS